MSFGIVTDSSANLTDEMIDKYGIDIISLSYRIGEEECQSYVKGEKTDLKQFYEKLRQGEVAETSLINMRDCENAFESVLQEGKDLLYIGFSSALSGTYNAASIVADNMREIYPQRKIYAIDSLAASMGQGLLVYHAVEQRLAGRSIDEVKDWLLENRLRLCHWFTVDDLMYLKRGGRVSVSAAVIGTVLSVKPVMHVDDEGKLVPVRNVRGRKKSLVALVDEMEKTCIDPTEQMVFISHGDSLEDAECVEKLVRERLNVRDVRINYVDPVIGAHSGPGTIALFFLGTKR
ncbi:MAG TPA: DegV family protein [Bacillota bacterium]|nr:DegV family protein [Bacillota bacterium]HOK69926.1 DegV family protein [Bacillota bacterium]HOL50626.1 DegV family protein [Bacillota bacterium]HOO30133.1 DegV family protein [Bacillota bacterium]HPZ13840.1 DegV family protein [Bacillota bacterium]